MLTRTLPIFGPLLLLPALAGCSPERTERTSLVLIVVDTLRADHVLDPQARVATPNLDALASDGVLFERAFAHTSWTLPSHTALFSSRPPHETGVVLNSQIVPDDLPLLAPWLKRQGYRTLAVHSLISLTPVSPGHGLDRGFDEFHERLDSNLGFARAQGIHDLATPVLEDLASTEDPFFLFVHYSDPHEPLHSYGTSHVPGTLTLNAEVVASIENFSEPQWVSAQLTLQPGSNRIEFHVDADFTPRVAKARSKERWFEVEVHYGEGDVLYGEIENPEEAPVEVEFTFFAYEVLAKEVARQRYILEIEHFDHWLGRLREELKRLGLYDEVLLVFTSDHGEGLGEHAQLSHGMNVFDEVLHVPLVIKPPAGHRHADDLAAGRDQLARHVDLVPTLLELLDLPALPGQTGTSLLQALERELEAESHYPLAKDMYAVFDGRHKLVFVPDVDSFYLFDLAVDPDETEDVIDQVDLDLEPWKERLRGMARDAEVNAVALPEDLPEGLKDQLRAVGYAGDH